MKLRIISEIRDVDILNKVVETVAEIFKIKAYYTIVDKIVESTEYDNKRHQYDAARIIERLKQLQTVKEGHELILLITDKDLYVDDLNFVFGYAPYPVGIVSTCRLNPEFYGQKFEVSIFVKRLLTEVIHELGHLIGLKHCSNPVCVMYFSSTILDTDRKSMYPCPRCMALATENINRLSPGDM